MKDTQPIDPDELLQQAAWVRGLARSLLFDPNEADDAAQQTWLVALTGDRRTRRDQRAWIAGVLRNVVRRQHRSDRRRERREAVAARPEATADTADLVAQAEMHRRVVLAVLDLEEPYRTTVLKRYFQDMSAETIAREEIVPGATVRSRLRRALEQLRGRLDRDFGDDRHAWSLALAPLAMAGAVARSTAASASRAASISSGVTIMSTQAKIVACSVVAVLALGTAWMTTQEEPADRRDGAVGMQDRAIEPRGAATGLLGPDIGQATKLDVQVPERAVDAVTPDTAAITGPLGGDSVTVTGRVVDEQGRSISDALVVFFPGERARQELGMTWKAHGPLLDVLPRTTTGSDGGFALDCRIPAGGPEAWDGAGGRFPVLGVRHDEYVVRDHVCLGWIAGDHDIGTLVLEPGGRFTGRLVDEQGRPVAGADLWVQQPAPAPRHLPPDVGWTSGEILGALTSDFSADDGRFTIGPFWPGVASCEIVADGHLPHRLDALDVLPGATRDLGDVELAAGGSLRGVVRDAEGAPVVGALLLADKQYGDEQRRQREEIHDDILYALRHVYPDASATTDADGAFALGGLEHANFALHVDARGFEPLVVRDVVPSGQALDLVVVRHAMLLLTVEDGAGAPVHGAQVRAVRRSGRAYVGGDPELVVLSGAEARAASGIEGPTDGVFLVERLGLWRTDLVVSAPRFGTRGVVVLGAVPPELVTRTTTMRREAVVTGRILDPDGAPVADATVVGRAPKASRVALPSAHTLSAADGSYTLRGLERGDWELAADAEGFVETTRPLTVPPEETLAEVDFVLEQSGVIHGTSLGADGSPRRGAQIHAFRAEDEAGPKAHAEALTDVEGAYRLTDLRAGTWTVRRDPEVVVELPPGGLVRVDLVESSKPKVHGRVLAGGAGWPHALVYVWGSLNGHETVLGGGRVDADGRFELPLRGPGTYRLVAYGFDPPLGSTPQRSVQVAEGQTVRVDLSFRGGPLAGRVVDAAGELPVADALVLLTDVDANNRGDVLLSLPDAQWWPVTDAEGRFRFPHVAPGNYRLRVRHPDHLEAVIDPLTVGEVPPDDLRVELTRGATVRGIVLLPGGVPVADDTMVYRQDDPAARPNGQASTKAGRFEFRGLPPGPSWFVVTTGNWMNGAFGEPVLAERYVNLAPGEVLELELKAKP